MHEKIRIVRSAIVLGVGLLVVFASTPASAIKCSEWTRLAPYQKANTIDDMIRDAISGQGGRQYQVRRGGIERCLYSKALDIEYDFDDTCADSRTASMQALNRLFKDYIWSCVR